MVFTVSPSQIKALNAETLVFLLRRLIYAEAQKTGISLRAVSAPLQITMPDRGEDARIEWTGGLTNTDFFPSRFTIFQAKAISKISPSIWKKEMWTTASRARNRSRQINPAVKNVINKRGAYVGFTSAVLIGKHDECINAIKSGISEAGLDPDALAEIAIYDANTIAEWTTSHPAIALWMNEIHSGLTLGGFQSISGWGKRSDFTTLQHVPDTAQRFTLGANTVFGQHENQPAESNTLDFLQAKERVFLHLTEPGTSVRIIGPSGIGKSRFCYETIRDGSSVGKLAHQMSAIYCSFHNVGHDLFRSARMLSEQHSPTLLVVDECPRNDAARLTAIAEEQDSQLRIITIDIDDRPIPGDNVLTMSIAAANDDLVEGIIRQRIPKSSDQDVAYMKKLCGGFPRIAVLATESSAGLIPLLNSIEDVVDRILEGCHITDRDAIRALECLCLFERLGADNEFSADFDLVATRLAGLSGDLMYEYIAHAAQHDIVDRRGRYYSVQPQPIRAFLALRRLELIRVDTLASFITDAPPYLRLSLLHQWRHCDHSATAVAVAENLLSPGGLLGTKDDMDTENGSACVDALVHVAPDLVVDALHRVIGDLSIDELITLTHGRRHLVFALEKLVFRQESFRIAARLLLRLAAAENETWGNNSTGQFQHLFRLYLSGTEAAPSDRFAVLDEALAEEDQRIIEVCLGALENTLDTAMFSRTGGSETIGTHPPLQDWRPKTWNDIFDFHRRGLRYLRHLRLAHPTLRDKCDKAIASHLRGLISEGLYDELLETIDSVTGDRPLWLEGISAIGDWLYFNRPGAPPALSYKVRELYDRLMPTDPVQQAVLYTAFWAANIRDPDRTVDEEDRDFDYSTRKAVELAERMAGDTEWTRTVLRVMAPMELHNAFPFARAIALGTPDPEGIFRFSVKTIETVNEIRSLSLVVGYLAGLDERDPQIADRCVDFALRSPLLARHQVQLYASVKLTPKRLQEIVVGVQKGDIPPGDCVMLSFGGRLGSLRPMDLLPLLKELLNKTESGGLWVALDILSMYQHDRKELDVDITDFLKKALASSDLFGGITKVNREGYHLERSVSMIAEANALDDDFAEKLCEQFTRLCQTDDYTLFFSMQSHAQKCITLLSANNPKPTWEIFSHFYEIASSLERNQLEKLVGPSRSGFDGRTSASAGCLFKIPGDEMISWVESDPAHRVEFLLYFYPVFSIEEDGSLVWHRYLEALAAQFGALPEFQNALFHRLVPTSWTGSLVPRLEELLPPLETWVKHPNAALSRWAGETHRSFEHQIHNERRRDEEES